MEYIWNIYGIYIWNIYIWNIYGIYIYIYIYIYGIYGIFGIYMEDIEYTDIPIGIFT